MRSTRTAGRIIALALCGVLAGGCGSDGGVAEDPKASAQPSEEPSEEPSALPRAAEFITLATPAEGATVSDSFEASGTANSFEANVPWEVRDASGETVLEGAATAEGSMDKLYPWTTTIDVSALDPGTYLFIARTDDPSDGEGKPAEEVGARIIVE